MVVKVKKQNLLVQRVDKEIKISKMTSTCWLSPLDADLQKVSQYLSQSILLEVSAYPKPGLVTRYSNGSHNDMSLITFMMSSAVLSKAFQNLQDIGLTHEGSEAELFQKIRSYGVLAEQELLRATKGVNTQRGILFAGGLISGAAGYAMHMGWGKEQILPIVSSMTKGLVEKELMGNDKLDKTAGEKLYAKYGITGIRGEVENGFPCIVNYGLPAMNEAFVKGANINDALVHTLIALMTVVEDSNVIWRTNIETAREVKAMAKDILRKGSIFTQDGLDAIFAAEKYFVNRRISPGGSADLLSVTITLYLLDNKEFPVAIF